MTQYTKQWFLEFVKNTPDDKWRRGMLEDSKGCKCMLGHLGVTDYTLAEQSPEVKDRVRALAELFKRNIYDWVSLYSINDSVDHDYEKEGEPPSEKIKQHVIKQFEALED